MHDVINLDSKRKEKRKQRTDLIGQGKLICFNIIAQMILHHQDGEKSLMHDTVDNVEMQGKTPQSDSLVSLVDMTCKILFIVKSGVSHLRNTCGDIRLMGSISQPQTYGWNNMVCGWAWDQVDVQVVKCCNVLNPDHIQNSRCPL